MVLELYFETLKSWCDAMLEYQVHDPGKKRFHGGLMCPSCLMIHGRSHDAVYPLLCMADRTGEERYLRAALELFDWGENLICDDGSFYNDAQGAWNGITVFAVTGLCEALTWHGHLLSEMQKLRFEERMRRGAQWIYETITLDFITNINYHATASAALALTGIYFERQDYLERARLLAHYCADHILEDGFLYGEGKPAEYVTGRGCRPVDIGYNVEETTPSLLMYARAVHDHEVLEKVKSLLRSQLDFMLPDGAWDNSFGTRNFKWTYWGSRTSDGCQQAYGLWGDEEPVFAEAALRNLELYRKCTHDGLLHGGPDYAAHGEPACIHHTFCHAKALAAALDHGIKDFERTELPSEQAPVLRYYPSVDTYKISSGGFLGTVTGYDFEYVEGGHASGGTLSMLWHREAGPLIMASMTSYSMREIHNMQLSRKKKEHQALTPRVEMMRNGVLYSQCYDYESVIESKEQDGEVWVTVEARLADIGHQYPVEPVAVRLRYHFMEDRLEIDGEVTGDREGAARWLLPVIGRHGKGYERLDGEVRFPAGDRTIAVTGLNGEPEPVFYLAAGFEAWMFCAVPDDNGRFQMSVQVR